ncbi:MAG: hypothetical protein U0905_18175 [Pirellulales bacterium]
MRSNTSRSWRGWVYGILVAALLSLGFWYADHYSQRKGKSFFLAERTTKHTAVSTSFPVEVATEEAPSVFQETLEIDESHEWQQVRSQPRTSIPASLEPSASIQLMAPQVPNHVQASELHEAAMLATRQPELPINQLASTPIVRPETMIGTRPSLNASAMDTIANTNSWPRPDSLMAQISHLMDDASSEGATEIERWTSSVSDILEQMASMNSMNDRRSAVHIEQMRDLADEVLRTTESADNIPSELDRRQYRIAYGLMRRVIVWRAIFDCMQTKPQGSNFVSAPRSEKVDFDHLLADLKQVRKDIQKTGDVPGWSNYLMLDDIHRIATAQEIDAERAMFAARMFLSRVTWQRVNDGQRGLLGSDAVQRVARNLHPLAFGPIDYRQLANDLEAIETDSVHRCRSAVAQQVQALRFASSKEQVELADAINTFYRNANLRLAISEELLQRCLPKQQLVERPVHSKILGADTRGASQVNTKLQVKLIPDKEAWNMELKLKGDVVANTRSSKGPATFYNDSTAVIDTARKIRVDVNGLKVSGENASVASQDRLRGFNTDFDSLPLLGDMLRFVVRQQFDSERGLAQRIMRRTMADQADTEFDRTLSTKVADAEKQLSGKVLKPLQRMELNPLVVDLETTEKRLIARYRVAGSTQMAAHTPRPLAPSDSQLSLQIHDSAINNAIDRLGLSGRTWTMQELSQQLADILDQPHWEMDASVPQDLSIRFADHRPVTVEFLDGKIELTLRIQELTQPGNLDLSNFTIRTSYEPMVSDLKLEMVHVGPISVDSQRDRLKLRTVFARVFAGRQTIPLISDDMAQDPRGAGLAISQAKLLDGWFAIAISPESSPHVANLRTADEQRKIR